MPEPLDEDYLLAFAAGQQSNTAPYQYPQCHRCGHTWHGLRCASGSGACECPSSLDVAS